MGWLSLGHGRWPHLDRARSKFRILSKGGKYSIVVVAVAYNLFCISRGTSIEIDLYTKEVTHYITTLIDGIVH